MMRIMVKIFLSKLVFSLLVMFVLIGVNNMVSGIM